VDKKQGAGERQHVKQETFSRHFSQGIDLMAGGGAKPAGRAINRLEIGLAIGSASTRRG
jgi:hypothetical protein